MERGPVTPSEAVEGALRERLAGMASGDPLPPVRTLASEFQVAPATVLKAMRKLKAEGLIGSRPGWATFKT